MFPGHGGIEPLSLRRFLNPRRFATGTIKVLGAIEAVLAVRSPVGRRTGQTVIQHRQHTGTRLARLFTGRRDLVIGVQMEPDPVGRFAFRHLSLSHIPLVPPTPSSTLL